MVSRVSVVAILLLRSLICHKPKIDEFQALQNHDRSITVCVNNSII